MTSAELLELQDALSQRRRVAVVFVGAACVAILAVLALVAAVASAGA
jgi:flagellar biosynthesis/type III secretory pathway M-ring protein FliF/YscJ